MEKIVKKAKESDKDYLLRVAIAYIDEEKVNIYDGAECDGYCLIDDIKIALDID